MDKYLGAELELEALLGKDLLEGLGRGCVHSSADRGLELDHGDLGTEAAPDRAELEADDASADDDQLLGDLLEREGAGRVDDGLLVDLA